MQYVTVERLIHRRPEIVWDALVDIRGLTGWIEGLVDVRPAEEARPLGEGSVLELVWRSAKSRFQATSEITAFRPAVLLAAETRTSGGLFFDRVRLERDSRGTRIEIVAEVMTGLAYAAAFVRPRGILLGPGGDTPLHRAYDRSADAFVRRVETMSEIPYR